MSMFNPADNPFLANLKNIALRGDSKEGRLYDQGVLAVVGRVERDGYYSVDPLGGILLLIGGSASHGLAVADPGGEAGWDQIPGTTGLEPGSEH